MRVLLFSQHNQINGKMQQPFTNSEAVRMCMVGPDAPLSSHIRYGPKPPYAVGKPRARPYSGMLMKILKNLLENYSIWHFFSWNKGVKLRLLVGNI